MVVCTYGEGFATYLAMCWERVMKEKEESWREKIPASAREADVPEILFDNKSSGNRKSLRMFEFFHVFNPCLERWLSWQTATSDTITLCLGPCCIKSPMSEALLLSAALWHFYGGLIQSDWPGRKWKEAPHSKDKHSLTTCKDCLLSECFHD